MKQKQIISIVCSVVVMLLSATWLLFGSTVANSLHGYPQYREIHFSSLSAMPKRDVLEVLKTGNWKLKVFISPNEIINPIKDREPSLTVSETNELTFFLGCNIVFTTEPNSTGNTLTFSDEGEVANQEKVITRYYAACDPRRQRSIEAKYFAPAVGKQGKFYSIDDNLLLHFSDTKSTFVFRNQ